MARRHSILARVSIAVIRHYCQQKLGEERVYFASQLISAITEGNQGKNSGQEPGGRNWSRGHGRVLLLTNLLFITFSACFLVEPKTTNPELA